MSSIGPGSHLLGLNVVVHRVAAVAGGPGRPLEIVGRIKTKAGLPNHGSPAFGPTESHPVGPSLVDRNREVAAVPGEPRLVLRSRLM